MDALRSILSCATDFATHHETKLQDAAFVAPDASLEGADFALAEGADIFLIHETFDWPLLGSRGELLMDAPRGSVSCATDFAAHPDQPQRPMPWAPDLNCLNNISKANLY